MFFNSAQQNTFSFIILNANTLFDKINFFLSFSTLKNSHSLIYFLTK